MRIRHRLVQLLEKTLTYVLFLVLGLSLFSTPALASGGSTHILAAELATEDVTEPEIQSILRNYAQTAIWAAWFPDGGYVVDDDRSEADYGELSHWGNFQETYWDTIRTDGSFPWVIAHFLGATSHGLGDEIFDSIFMAYGRELGEDVGSYDVNLDLLLVDEQRRRGRVRPGILPVPTLTTVYDQLGLDGQRVGRKALIANRILYAGILGEQVLSRVTSDDIRQQIPWGASHYMDAPGGVRFMAHWIAQFWDQRGKILANQSLAPTWPLLARYPATNTALSQSDPVYGMRQPLFVFFGTAMDCPTVRQTPWVAQDLSTGTTVSLRVSNIYNPPDCHLFRLDPATDWPQNAFEIQVQDPLPSFTGEFEYTANRIPDLDH